jgi:hypothetical protein
MVCKTLTLSGHRPIVRIVEGCSPCGCSIAFGPNQCITRGRWFNGRGCRRIRSGLGSGVMACRGRCAARAISGCIPSATSRSSVGCGIRREPV